MADALLSMAADRIIGLIEEQSRYNVNLVRGAEKEVRCLADDLQNIRSAMDDAENRKFSNANVNRWLSKLEQTTHELDYVLDEWNYAIRTQQISDVVALPKQKVCSFVPLSSCLGFKKFVFLHDIARKLLNVRAQIDEILLEKDKYGFVISKPTVDLSPYSWRVTNSFIGLKGVYGRDMDMEYLISILMDNSCSMQEEFGIRVVSIVGVGGLGKTTLAQLVYNHIRVMEYFELRIWVCVSDPFDLVAISKGILESINKNSVDTHDLDALLRMVRASIYGKIFLLVLDEVWTEEYRKWEPLEAILRCGGTGSRVLVTTRSQRVVKMMGSNDSEIYHLGTLTDDDCWSILCYMAFRGRDNGLEFVNISQHIAKKCKGLPLTAQTLGRLLYFKSSRKEWENVLTGEIWQMKEAEVAIFPHLLLSYKDLSPTLKLCFSYCAVFPKDTEIIVENLIESWMALGYLGSDVGNMELKGRECFNVLAMRSLFQDFEKDDMNEIQSCKMHDIIHDFAQFLLKKSGRVEEPWRNVSRNCQTCDPLHVSIANAFSTLHWDEETPPNFCECLRCLRVLSLKNCGLQSIPQGMEHLNHLRCLKLTGITKMSHEDLKIIFRLDLQTLSLEKCNLEVIPKEIGNLIHLRRLNLSCNESLKELPREIGNLIQLRHLNLNLNKSLKELPREIGKLIDLTHLNLSWNESLKDLPGEIWNLIHLRLLSLTGNKYLEELPKEFGNLVHMRRLDLSWNVLLKKLPNEIRNLVFLRHFNLRGNKSLVELPESIGDLQELQTLNILGCKRICLPEGVAKLIGLRTLNEFRGGSGCNKFALLKNLNNVGGVLWLRIRLVGEFDLAEMVEDARAAELSNKTRIGEFRIYFEESSTSSSVSLDVVDVLEPHSNLRELSIWNYGGSGLPKWMLFSQVRNLNLHFCKHLTSLPPFGKLPCLEELCIDAMEALKTVGREFLGITTGEGGSDGDVIAFPRLKTLEFRDCGEWQEWEDVTEEEESAATSVMPCLTELTITGCIGLTLLPHRLLRKASKLEMLRISGSTELVRRYGNEDDSIPINNPRVHLICHS